MRERGLELRVCDGTVDCPDFSGNDDDTYDYDDDDADDDNESVMEPLVVLTSQIIIQFYIKGKV